MEKIFFPILVVFAFFLSSFSFVWAKNEGTIPARLRERIREEVLEKIQERRELRKKKIAKIMDGEITAISGEVLTVKKGEKSYQVKIEEKTRLRRRFWGKSELSEFSVGDKVNIWGIWSETEEGAIVARMIRNLSIQKRYGVFFGTVKTKENSSLVITTLQRGEQTVFFTTETRFIDRKGSILTADEIKAGHKVRVRGLWDRTLSQITQVGEIKDFSLPPKPTITP